jgi:hypothetical protein
MDDTTLARMSFPQLSSVSLGTARRGRLAAEMLLSRLLEPDRPPRREMVPTTLVVRASSTPAIPAAVPGIPVPNDEVPSSISGIPAIPAAVEVPTSRRDVVTTNRSDAPDRAGDAPAATPDGRPA